MSSQRRASDLFSTLVSLVILAAVIFGLVWLKVHAFNPLDKLLQ